VVALVAKAQLLMVVPVVRVVLFPPAVSLFAVAVEGPVLRPRPLVLVLAVAPALVAATLKVCWALLILLVLLACAVVVAPAGLAPPVTLLAVMVVLVLLRLICMRKDVN
jgi:hypothetical protein